MSSGDIARTGLEAWHQLGQCGLEIEGRDADLAETIRKRIDANAGTLEEALANCSSEAFLKTFLVTAEPFVKMLAGILRMFEMAGTKHGKHHWKVAFDDYEASVEHFKEWERVFNSIGSYEEVPSLTRQAWHQLAGLARTSFVEGRKGDTGAFWDTLKPRSELSAPGLHSEPWMRDLWALILRAEQVFYNAGLDLVTARQNIDWSNQDEEGEDGFALGFLRKFQHDYQVSQLIAAYQVFLSNDEARQDAGGAMSALLATVSRTKYWTTVTTEELTPFLQLPIWQKRHEFYAAWVASEQIAVFRGSGVDVHSEEGRITFPFRETRVATLHAGHWSLISERRTSLDAPLGAGRKGNVQPDYGWWQEGGDGQETCALVVEVKHYKKAASRSWIEVLTDYATAHPNAEVLLVNYGRGGRAAETLAETHKKRCRIIGELHPNSPASLQEFREAVVRIVATPKKARNVIVLDVSPSMNLERRKLSVALREIAARFGCEDVFAVDDEIVSNRNVATLQDDEIQAFSRNKAEKLGGPLAAILGIYDAVWLVTDSIGATSIRVDPRFHADLLVLPGLDHDLTLVEVRTR